MNCKLDSCVKTKYHVFYDMCLNCIDWIANLIQLWTGHRLDFPRRTLIYDLGMWCYPILQATDNNYNKSIITICILPHVIVDCSLLCTAMRYDTVSALIWIAHPHKRSHTYCTLLACILHTAGSISILNSICPMNILAARISYLSKEWSPPNIFSLSCSIAECPPNSTLVYRAHAICENILSQTGLVHLKTIKIKEINFIYMQVSLIIL